MPARTNARTHTRMNMYKTCNKMYTNGSKCTNLCKLQKRNKTKKRNENLQHEHKRMKTYKTFIKRTYVAKSKMT